MPPKPPLSKYSLEAERYFHEYKQLYFSDVHRQFIKYLPKRKGAQVLDVGCGSGRDALSLAKRGYQVTAVDPSDELLDFARSSAPPATVTWGTDALPELKNLGARQFDFILVSAVWMHLAPHQREPSLRRLKALLSDNGYLAVTLRLGTPDISRSMYELNTEEFLTQAKATGFDVQYVSRSTKDSLSRPDVHWKKVVLKKAAQ